jgi:formate dehydrogenase major subunit
MMEKPDMTVSRWVDGVLEERADRPGQQPARNRFWGHAPNSQTRGEMVEAMKSSIRWSSTRTGRRQRR